LSLRLRLRKTLNLNLNLSWISQAFFLHETGVEGKRQGIKHGIRGFPQTHADIIDGCRAIFVQMPGLVSAIAFCQTPPSCHFDIFRSPLKAQNLTPDSGKNITVYERSTPKDVP